MLWADPTDLSVFAAVTGLDVTDSAADEDGLVSTAVHVASEVLTLATAHLVHPAGTSVEEFICTPRFRRFSPIYSPVAEVLGVTQLNRQGEEHPLDRTWTLVGNTVYFYGPAQSTQVWRHITDCAPDQGVFRITYRFASTLSRAAYRSVLEYAHELWLSWSDADECSLPERVTSLSREGVELTLLTPTDYLDKGKVGLPRVDNWLALMNPKQARRPSGVYTPDSPPGVNTRLQRI